MNIEALCCVGLLAAPDALAAIVPMLAAPDRERAEAAIAKLKPLGREQWIARWTALRDAEWAGLARLAERAGVRLSQLTPAAQEWLGFLLADANG